MKAITPDLEYLSTRQSAKVLNVSLGTVQKMVELGELIAWKTRGGHRRILASSLQQQLQRRQRSMRQKASTHCVLMGIFRRTENSLELANAMARLAAQSGYGDIHGQPRGFNAGRFYCS